MNKDRINDRVEETKGKVLAKAEDIPQQRILQ